MQLHAPLGKSSSKEAKAPPEKVLRGGGGMKKSSTSKCEIDIPFIDETVDEEGNILSPVKSFTPLVNGDSEVESLEEGEKLLQKKETPAVKQLVKATPKPK